MALDLPSIVAAEKLFPVIPHWAARPNDWLELVSPLDIDGVTIQGLRFRATARSSLPDEYVTFQLEYVPPKANVKGGPLCRIEWRALGGHNNKGAGPPEHRFKSLEGSHHHPFELNWTEQAAAVRQGNLPIAIPFPEDVEDGYHGVVAFVRREFRIVNADELPIPPWMGRLV